MHSIEPWTGTDTCYDCPKSKAGLHLCLALSECLDEVSIGGLCQGKLGCQGSFQPNGLNQNLPLP